VCREGLTWESRRDTKETGAGGPDRVAGGPLVNTQSQTSNQKKKAEGRKRGVSGGVRRPGNASGRGQGGGILSKGQLG